MSHSLVTFMRRNHENSLDLLRVEGGEVNSTHYFEKQVAR